MKVVIIIPTYNEKENIGLLITALHEASQQFSQHTSHLLVVDDNSPDGTAAEVKAKQKKYKNLHLITGKKEGLGKAYLRGMDYASDKLGAEVMFEMDADFSHDPKLIPKFLEKIDQGYDLVVGSRYTSGGDTGELAAGRVRISRFATILSGQLGSGTIDDRIRFGGPDAIAQGVHLKTFGNDAVLLIAILPMTLAGVR